MKKLQGLLSKKQFVRKAADFVRGICYFMIGIYAFLVVLCALGRLEYGLQYDTGQYISGRIYAGEVHDYTMSNWTVRNVDDDLYVTVQSDTGNIKLSTYVAISGMYIIGFVVVITSLGFLSKVFNNVAKGEIFTEKNARYLLYYSVIQIALTVVYPVLKRLIVYFANVLGEGGDFIRITMNMPNFQNVVLSVAVFVAAYIIKYGVDLQDEADHTL